MKRAGICVLLCVLLAVQWGFFLMNGSRQFPGNPLSPAKAFTPEAWAASPPPDSAQNSTTPPESAFPPESATPSETTSPSNSAASSTPSATAPDTPSPTTSSATAPSDTPNPSQLPKPSSSGAPNPSSETSENSAEPPEPVEEPVVVTDLPSGICDTSTVAFYAYISGGTADLSLRVNLQNDQTPANGVYLTPSGIQYEAPLAVGPNRFTFYIKRGGEIYSYVSFTLTYQPRRADAGHPQQGGNPPTIVTNRDGRDDEVRTPEFRFTVSARTAGGQPLRNDHIQLALDGTILEAASGYDTCEYELFFPTPVHSETEEHIVSVLAWDDAGNSAYREYSIVYHYVSEGSQIGTVYVVLDATTVGMGILDEIEWPLKSGQTAASVLLEALNDYGYEAMYSGSAEANFYLQRISRPDLCYGAAVPQNLWNTILNDGIEPTAPGGPDTLGQTDYTRGSGWIYLLDGSSPSSDMASVLLNDGQTLTLRFTLAYGKDVVGQESTGYGGKFSHYCGVWIDGGYQEWFGHEYTLDDGSTADACIRCGAPK